MMMTTASLQNIRTFRTDFLNYTVKNMDFNTTKGNGLLSCHLIIHTFRNTFHRSQLIKSRICTVSQCILKYSNNSKSKDSGIIYQRSNKNEKLEN